MTSQEQKAADRPHEEADVAAALARLKARLAAIARDGNLSIAYSGGLDSRFLAFFAKQNGFEVELLHAQSAHISREETQEAIGRAAAMGLTVRCIRPDLPDPMRLARALRDRCYVCKKAIFTVLLKEAHAPLCDGSNASDALVFRPGSRAISELGVGTPLADAGLSKPMIRQAAAALGLSDPQQPARPCLLTRFDYGDAPNPVRLDLTQRAEAFLDTLPALKAGFRLRWLGPVPLLHVSAANGLSAQQMQAVRTALISAFPALENVRIEALRELSGWFDRVRPNEGH